MGRRQAVRHRFLESAFVGSNPTAPAKKSNSKLSFSKVGTLKRYFFIKKIYPSILTNL